MTNQEKLINYICQLSNEDITILLDIVTSMIGIHTIDSHPDCPYCSSPGVIRYGHKCGKQRFLCKECGRTFVPTTHTIMSNPHFLTEVWGWVIEGTLRGGTIDFTAERLGFCTRQFLT